MGWARMNNQTILLIDYDPASISKTATPLTKAGYQVEVAKDGLSGLAAFERMKPALVLVEAMLPRKHGFEVCQEIKAKPEGKTTPVLITTAVCRGRKYRMDALQIYGCDEYIEKPITDDELLKMIDRFVRQANEAREQVQHDLSEAIDGATSGEASPDVPVAIETMGDDELEAKIDALLEGDDPVAEGAKILAPPVAQGAPGSAAPAEASDNGSDHAKTDRRLDALFQSDPTAIEQPSDEAEALRIEAQPSTGAPATEPHDAAAEAETSAPETPALETDTDWFAPQPEAQAEPASAEPASVAPPDPMVEDEAAPATAPAPREWTETAARKGGGSKAILIGVAAVVVAGLMAFLAFRQGWIGNDAAGATGEPVGDPAPRTPSPITHPSQPPEGKTEPFDTGIAAQIEPEPIESAPAEVQPKATQPKPAVPPKPQVFTGRTQEELDAARARQRQADRALNSAAGSLQSQLLAPDTAEPATAGDEPAIAVDIDDAIPLGAPVRPKAQRGQLYPLAEVDESPTRVRFEQPEYDAVARRMNQQGVVVVDVLIDETGKVTETRLVREIPNSRLNDSTLRAARRWTYTPAIKDGVPVMVWKPERIAFELE